MFLKVDFINTDILFGWNAKKQVLANFSYFLVGSITTVCLKLPQLMYQIKVVKSIVKLKIHIKTPYMVIEGG